MRHFCEEVLKYLRSEYDDSYQFEVKCWLTRPWLTSPPRLGVPRNEKAELTIKLSQGYQYVIEDYVMQYLFGCYRAGIYIEERNQYVWQKELIDMIEGG
jgi:hypothetical protein